MYPCCRLGVLPHSDVICGLGGLRHRRGCAEGGGVPFFLPLHIPVEMLASAPLSPENSNQVMSQTSGSWEVGEKNAERRKRIKPHYTKVVAGSTG